MSFSFGFEDDDDIETTDADMKDAPSISETPRTTQKNGQAVPSAEMAKSHSLKDLVKTPQIPSIFFFVRLLISAWTIQLSGLPSNISYSFVEIESPKGRKLRIPRRELFDVKMQLMAEDEGGTSDEKVNLDDSDIRTNVYEGGYKSWECSFDLAKLLLDRGPRKDLDDLCRVDHVVEVC
jgi:protein-histidine N-methyltransferase